MLLRGSFDSDKTKLSWWRLLHLGYGLSAVWLRDWHDDREHFDLETSVCVQCFMRVFDLG